MSVLDVSRAPADRSFGPARRRSARTAGLGLLAMTLLAVPASAGLTSGSEVSVRASALTFLVVALLDVVVGLALGRFLRPASPRWAVAAAWTRVGYGVGFAVVAALLAAGPEAAAVDRFDDRWDVLLGFFGVHLLAVAVALSVRRTAPVLVALATSLAGASYLVDVVASRLFPDVRLGFLVPLMLGELVLMGWLLWLSRGRAPRRPA